MPNRQDDLNVLVISRLYPRPADPVLGIFVEEEVTELARLCKVKVVSPAPWFPPLKIVSKWYDYSQLPVRETRRGIEVLRPRTLLLPRNLLFPLYGFFSYLTLRRWMPMILEDFPIDLIHAHTVYPDGFAAVMLGKALNLPTVVTLHGGDVTLYFQRYFGRKLGLWALSNADRVIAVSSSLRRTVVEEYGADDAKITVIPNGVDVTRFAPIPQSEARDRLRLQGDGPMVLYVGAITTSKGIGYLLRAYKLLLSGRSEPVQLILLGDGDYEQRARLLASELDIADSVTFVGKRSNEEIPLWMNACDLLVLPSLREGFGVVLVEAMACGKPLVATACGGPEDIVTPQTGILVPPANEAALAQALRDTLCDGTRFLPPVIRQRALDNYAYDTIAPQILSLYKQALQG
jgi:glycosyltransferase involved in cell wall biosynthesis